jgi:SAM-dependent methyltransferase
MELGGELTRPDTPWPDTATMIRGMRSHIAYAGKHVLDVATFDGMWAFEAERLGAASVVAIDITRNNHPNSMIAQAHAKFLYARQKLNSNVLPYFDRSVHKLHELLPLTGRFDIIQNLGLLYHQFDIVQALMQCRRALNDGGLMLLETAYDPDLKGCTMRFNRGPTAFYAADITSYWAPSEDCLEEMLKCAGFEVNVGVQIRQTLIGRICMICRAVPLTWDFEEHYRL